MAFPLGLSRETCAAELRIRRVPHFEMNTLSRTERCLRLFTDVKPGEGTTAVMMFANVFLILLAYYFVKPLREGWIAVSEVEGLSTMEIKAYSSFAQSILLLFVIGWYTRLADAGIAPRSSVARPCFAFPTW